VLLKTSKRRRRPTQRGKEEVDGGAGGGGVGGDMLLPWLVDGSRAGVLGMTADDDDGLACLPVCLWVCKEWMGLRRVKTFSLEVQ